MPRVLPVRVFLLKTGTEHDVTRLLEAHALPRDVVDVMSESVLEDDGYRDEPPCYILADNCCRE